MAEGAEAAVLATLQEEMRRRRPTLKEGGYWGTVVGALPMCLGAATSREIAGISTWIDSLGTKFTTWDL